MDVQHIPEKIERIKERIQNMFGDEEAEVSIDWPENPRGNHFIDVRARGRIVVIEWRPGQQTGYGLSRFIKGTAADYGGGPDVVIPEVEELLLLRVKELFE